MRNAWYGRSVIESQDFDMDTLQEVFRRADAFKKDPIGHGLRRKRVSMLFYEPSTRTRFSFEAAVLDMGGSCISTENAGQFSSAAKGESLEDTIRVVSAYCDAIVLRHFEDDAAERARDLLQSLRIKKPIINAGCGKGQHPTQSLIDLYTIKDELKNLVDLNVTIVGDLKHSRVVKSLVYLLSKYDGSKITLVSPVELALATNMIGYLEQHRVTYQETQSLEDAIATADVVYMTRVQKERFEDPAVYERLKNSYRLTPALVAKMRPHARILHPLPRVDEIDPAIDRLPQVAYFRQSDNGVPIRKALLEMVLGE